jgi:site-specific DNA-methyltransferase (adenine-specific)/modification methylase
VRRGTIEQIGRATLYLGDCRDILPMLGKVDAVVTDPPYGIKAAKDGTVGASKSAAVRDFGNADWDNEPIAAELLQSIRSAGRWQIVFGGNYYDCPPASCWLVWDKLNSGNFADAELAWTNLPKAVRVIRYLWNGMIREQGAQRGDHPTQKPLEVMKWCIGHLPEPNDLILDPFMGSGTTGVAAIQMGKAFIGIEREERYFEAACRRIREANGDDAGPLFGEAA